MSADPTVPDPFASQSFNRYSYVLGNPLSFTDPTGLCAFTTGSHICGGGGGNIVYCVGNCGQAISNNTSSLGNPYSYAGFSGSGTVPTGASNDSDGTNSDGGNRSDIPDIAEVITVIGSRYPHFFADRAAMQIRNLMDSMSPYAPYGVTPDGTPVVAADTITCNVGKGGFGCVRVKEPGDDHWILMIDRKVQSDFYTRHNSSYDSDEKVGVAARRLYATHLNSATDAFPVETTTWKEIAKAAAALTVVQTGGNTLDKRAANRLNREFETNLPSREWGRALEELKDANNLPNNWTGKIWSNGDVTTMEGEFIDNLGAYIP